MSVARLFSSTGTPVALGRGLGTGGEGSVHHIASDPKHVAKVYHKVPDRDKQDKLRYMASLRDEGLTKFVAWPIDTLHVSPGGPIRGFVMSNASGYVPAHSLYNPGHRKQEHPQLSWDNLVVIARNTADAFSEIHKRGVVVGDVNENSVMVAPLTGHVMLIDADSFQVNANGRTFPSLVGVPDFTPPELHSIGNFSRMVRTPNHDNFGLAILIFQLLLGGRHPFAGKPLRQDVGNDMSVDISAFRFADAPDNTQRGLVPAPAAVPSLILPVEMRKMFTQAFTEQGPNLRPSAQQWVSALDHLLRQRVVCTHNAHHVFASQAGACPWCLLERRGFVHFVKAQVAAKVRAAKIAVPALWSQIMAIRPPVPIVAPPITDLVLVARPLPANVHSKIAPTVVWPILLVLSLVALILGFWPVTIALVGATWVWHSFYGRPRKLERKQRLKAVLDARAASESVTREVEDLGPAGFEAIRASLAKLYEEYTVDIPKRERMTLAAFERTAQEHQLLRHLERQYIDTASISGVGRGLKQSLAAYGINTAADVDPSQIIEIRGFGPAKTSAMVAWRDSCSQSFRYNPNDPATIKEREQSVAVHENRRHVIESSLQAGLSGLQRRSQIPPSMRVEMEQKLLATARQLAQATADLSIT